MKKGIVWLQLVRFFFNISLMRSVKLIKICVNLSMVQQFPFSSFLVTNGHLDLSLTNAQYSAVEFIYVCLKLNVDLGKVLLE